MSYEAYRPQEYTMADQASADERGAFIVRTYLHLIGAVLAFIVLEAALVASPVAPMMFNLLATSKYSWLLVLGAFMAVSWIADRWAQSDTSVGMQYAGLGLYVVAEAVIFLPLIVLAIVQGGASIIGSAALTTALVFLGLTVFVFATRKNFSFLGPFLGVAGLGAIGIIVCAILFGFNLGIFFSGAMVVLAAGYILYSTSNILHTYRTDQHVAAALALFASVALLFWYILRIYMSRD